MKTLGTLQISFAKGSAILIAWLGLMLLATYNIIGNYVRDDGLLVEPFYLVGVAYLCFFSAFAIFIASLFADVLKIKV